MFDCRQVTIKIKTGSTHIVIPDVEIIYWSDYVGYDFYTNSEVENFQLTQIILPPWAECFREKIKKRILDDMKTVHKTRTGGIINVD
jgi:hypothetical protein